MMPVPRSENTIGAARAMYARRGYIESGILPTVFNGITGVDLVCLEKRLSAPGGADRINR